MLHPHHNLTDPAELIDWIPEYYTIGPYLSLYTWIAEKEFLIQYERVYNVCIWHVIRISMDSGFEHNLPNNSMN